VTATLGPVLRLRPLLLILVALASMATFGIAVASARAPRGTPVPQGFVGVDIVSPPLGTLDQAALAHQFDLMVANGVETVRMPFNWAAAQPYRNWSDVPADQLGEFVDGNGVPTNFAATDEVVQLAAQRGITVLPTVLYAPDWDRGQNSQGPIAPPARPGPYASFLTALIQRYGPSGSFWSDHTPRVPIRTWQIWNEENLTYNWPQPFAKSYAALLKASHRAIKRADSHATVVLGALTNVAWQALGQLNQIRGAKRNYDAISVNGFTKTPDNVIAYLQFMRRAAGKQGVGSKPLLATELSWPSAKGKSPQNYDWNTTEAGQARKISALLPLLAAHRKNLNLIGFYYYTWMGQEARGEPAFDFAGLLRLESDGRIVAKPALTAFRKGALALEGCRRKKRVATRCA
jgi:polysaccharide biosynthesis protein PslG